MVLLDQTLTWAIVGVVVTALGVLAAYLTLFKKPPKPQVHVSYFPHANLVALLELTNLGVVGVTVRYLIVSSDLARGSQAEMYPMSEAILPNERQQIAVFRQARQYFDAHMSTRYKTGQESRKPIIRVSFRCEDLSGHSDTKPFLFEGQINGGALVDLQPLKDA
jgi:hypothetical protein